MNIVMVHPEHGAKVATNKEEYKNDIKAGWTEHEPSEAKPAKVEKPKRKRRTTRAKGE